MVRLCKQTAAGEHRRLPGIGQLPVTVIRRRKLPRLIKLRIIRQMGFRHKPQQIAARWHTAAQLYSAVPQATGTRPAAASAVHRRIQQPAHCPQHFGAAAAVQTDPRRYNRSRTALETPSVRYSPVPNAPAPEFFFTVVRAVRHPDFRRGGGNPDKTVFHIPSLSFPGFPHRQAQEPQSTDTVRPLRAAESASGKLFRNAIKYTPHFPPR